MPVMVFVVAQLLLGCGGSPLLTLGTTYVDDHVRPESSSMYIGTYFDKKFQNVLNRMSSNDSVYCACIYYRALAYILVSRKDAFVEYKQIKRCVFCTAVFALDQIKTHNFMGSVCLICHQSCIESFFILTSSIHIMSCITSIY